MKSSGTGRIVMWQGGSLWIGRGGEPTGLHAHHAVQLTLPLHDEPVRLCTSGGGWQTYRAAIVAANQTHALDARGILVASLFVEPESRAGRAIGGRCRGADVLALDTALVATARSALAAAYGTATSDQQLEVLCRDFIGSLGAVDRQAAPMDTRIERALAVLRERVGETVLLQELADAAYLSPDRFRHLFIKETGLRFRPYVLWLRIELALAACIRGKSLTEAAQIGGFADSAHFSRTFRRMFGVSPSSIVQE